MENLPKSEIKIATGPIMIQNENPTLIDRKWEEPNFNRSIYIGFINETDVFRVKAQSTQGIPVLKYFFFQGKSAVNRRDTGTEYFSDKSI